MTTVPHDWDVTIDCPECGQRGRVTVSSMKAVLHCPACRARIVVGRDGVKKAGRDVILAGQTALLTATAAASIASPPRPERPRAVKEAGRPASRRKVLLGVALFMAAIGLALSASRWLGSPATNRFDLESQANAFGAALLSDDLVAGAKASGLSPAVLKPWWQARRAALTAGFGKHARGEVRSPRIEETGGAAVVRLPIVIQGREQFFFQDWKRSADGWRLQVESAPSARRSQR